MNKMSPKSKNTNNPNQIWIYGRHPIISILRNNQRSIFKIVVTKNNEQELYKILKDNSISPKTIEIEISTSDKISSTFGDQKVVHQGFAILCSKRHFISDNEFLASLKDKNLRNIIILDQLTDPHNIGAIIRSASAFGVVDVIIPKQHFHGETATIHKSSVGAIENINLILAGNINNLIAKLKDMNYWVLGLAGEGKSDLSEIRNYDNICLIIGSEGDGIRHQVKKNCDL